MTTQLRCPYCGGVPKKRTPFEAYMKAGLFGILSSKQWRCTSCKNMMAESELKPTEVASPVQNTPPAAAPVQSAPVVSQDAQIQTVQEIPAEQETTFVPQEQLKEHVDLLYKYCDLFDGMDIGIKYFKPDSQYASKDFLNLTLEDFLFYLSYPDKDMNRYKIDYINYYLGSNHSPAVVDELYSQFKERRDDFSSNIPTSLKIFANAQNKKQDIQKVNIVHLYKNTLELLGGFFICENEETMKKKYLVDEYMSMIEKYINENPDTPEEQDLKIDIKKG